jgi:hypothetical protein
MHTARESSWVEASGDENRHRAVVVVVVVVAATREHAAVL